MRQNSGNKIDWREIGRLAEIQCTGQEIAHVTGLAFDDLDAECREEQGSPLQDFIDRHSRAGNVSLRRIQWKILEGNFLVKKVTRTHKDGSESIEECYAAPSTNMAIFMAKNQLGQKDAPRPDPAGRDWKPLKVECVPVPPKTAHENTEIGNNRSLPKNQLLT
jgi:hypothetical protein